MLPAPPFWWASLHTLHYLKRRNARPRQTSDPLPLRQAAQEWRHTSAHLLSRRQPVLCIYSRGRLGDPKMYTFQRRVGEHSPTGPLLCMHELGVAIWRPQRKYTDCKRSFPRRTRNGRVLFQTASLVLLVLIELRPLPKGLWQRRLAWQNQGPFVVHASPDCARQKRRGCQTPQSARLGDSCWMLLMLAERPAKASSVKRMPLRTFARPLLPSMVVAEQ